MRNVLDKSFGENKNTRFYVQEPFFAAKTVRFMK
jgi:hypothetical protein